MKLPPTKKPILLSESKENPCPFRICANKGKRFYEKAYYHFTDFIKIKQLLFCHSAYLTAKNRTNAFEMGSEKNSQHPKKPLEAQNGQTYRIMFTMRHCGNHKLLFILYGLGIYIDSLSGNNMIFGRLSRISVWCK